MKRIVVCNACGKVRREYRKWLCWRCSAEQRETEAHDRANPATMETLTAFYARWVEQGGRLFSGPAFDSARLSALVASGRTAS